MTFVQKIITVKMVAHVFQIIEKNQDSDVNVTENSMGKIVNSNDATIFLIILTFTVIKQEIYYFKTFLAKVSFF